MRTPSYVSRAPDEYDKAYDAGYEAYSEGKSISSYEFRQDYNYSLFPSYWATAFKDGWRDAEREDRH